MARFEELLLERLKQHEPDPGAALPPRRRLAPVVVAATAVLAALAAVVLPSLGEGGPTAQAVTLNPDGTVTINLREDLDNIDVANRELRELGVSNIVIVGYSEPGGCAPEDLPKPGDSYPNGLTMSVTDDAGSREVIRLELIPPGHTVLVIGEHRVFDGGEVISLRTDVVLAQERYCEEHLPRPAPPPSR